MAARFSGGSIAKSEKPGGYAYIDGDVYIGSAKGDQMKAGSLADTKMSGLGGNDVMIGYAGNDRFDGGAGADDLNGGGGNDLLLGGDGGDKLSGADGADELWGDAAIQVVVPGHGQITTLTFASSYDIGDVITVVFNEVEFTQTIASTDPYVFDAANFTGLSGALAAANVGVAVDGSVATFTDTDANAIDGAFTLSADVTDVSATPNVVMIDLDSASVKNTGSKLVVTLNGTSYESAVTDGTNVQDNVLASFVATHGAAINAASGGTLSYDAEDDQLILTGNADGTALTLGSGFSGQVLTSSGTAESNQLTVTKSGSSTGNDDGEIVFHHPSFAGDITVSYSDNSAVGVATAIAENEELLDVFTITRSTAVVTMVWKTTGDVANLTFTDVDTEGTIVATQGMNFTLVVTDGTGGSFAPDGAAVASTTVTEGVTVTDHDAPADALVQSAADETASLVVGTLSADVLTGGAGADKFVILTNDSQTMLAGNVFDTIADLNLDADTIGLVFGIDTIAGPGTITGATLAAAVQTLFDAGGALENADNTAGVFTYNLVNYLVMTSDGGTAFGIDDAIVKLTGVTGTLDTGDFYVVTEAAAL